VLAAWWAGLGDLAAALGRRLAPGRAALVLLVLASHPSAMIAHAWTCHPDALTFLLTALLMFARKPWLAGAIAAVGAWNHAPMWAVICAQTALLWLGFAEPRARGRVVAVGLGFVVGAVSCRLTLALAGVQIGASRLELAMQEGVATLVRYWTEAGWPAVYSLHFAHLLWLPWLLLRLERRAALAVVAAQALALLATFFTQDTTRVFAFLGWGSLVYGLVHALGGERREGRDGLPRLVAAAVVCSLVAPKVYAWKGALHDTARARAHLRALLVKSASGE
jgi:hypothetical protein